MAAVGTDGSGCKVPLRSGLAMGMGIAVVETAVGGLAVGGVAVVDTDDPRCNMTLASELAVGNGIHVAAVDMGSPTCKVLSNSEMGGIDVDDPATEGIAGVDMGSPSCEVPLA